MTTRTEWICTDATQGSAGWVRASLSASTNAVLDGNAMTANADRGNVARVVVTRESLGTEGVVNINKPIGTPVNGQGLMYQVVNISGKAVRVAVASDFDAGDVKFADIADNTLCIVTTHWSEDLSRWLVISQTIGYAIGAQGVKQ
jgi:hypothetical protein